MKIVSWNCGGKFREKFLQIQKFDADIYIIQECEDPQKYPNTPYAQFAQNHIWVGENPNKGLAVFAKDTIDILNNNWEPFCLRHFLSVRINNAFDLLAVWACKPYIEEFYIYQAIHFDKFTSNMVIIGDFNSNAIWDKKNETRTHTAVVNHLQSLGLDSAYHIKNHESHGAETKSTFFLYRHPDKGYHIDYAFLKPSSVKSFEIASNDGWLQFSDHKPVVLEYK